MKSVKIYLIQARIWQWVKNLLVFVPLVFASKALNQEDLLRAIVAFFSFGFAASFVYLLNDIFDIEEDRFHPKKKHRPLASGNMSLKEASIFGSVLLFLAIASSAWLGLSILYLILFYLVANLIYSKKIKHYAVIDIVVVAMFYLYRVYFGGLVINVPISGWLILTTFFISLFMVTGKRRAELVTATDDKVYSRKVLNQYNEKFLDYSLVMALTLFIIFYSLYAIFVHDRIFAISIFLIIFIALRYLYLIFAMNKGEEPEKIIFTDIQILITGLLLGIFLIANIYFDISGFIKI
jgi:4-hydroxybenzoate polyprenyltransferase